MGLFDMTPDQADNLTNFGFATMANAATPGATLGGAIGKGGLGMNEAALQRAQTQNIGAEAQQKQLSNQLIPLNIQYMKMRLQQAQQDQADDNGTPSPNSGGQPWGATVGGSSPSTATSARPVNNPGNLRPVGATSGFQQFSTPDAGMQAMKQDLLAKINGSPSMNGQPASLRNIIYTYAPPSENNTPAYLENVSKQSGIAPNQILTAGDIDKILPLMVKQEGNSMPDQRNIGQGATSQVTQQSSLNLPPELQKQIKRLRQERNLTFDPAEQAKIDQQITQIYQNLPEAKQKQATAEAIGKNDVEVDQKWSDSYNGFQQQEERLTTVANALKQAESGQWATNKAQILSGLKSVGITLTPDQQKDVNGVQVALHEQGIDALTELKNMVQGAGGRITNAEFTRIADFLANPELQPWSNKIILSEGLGLAKYGKKMIDTWSDAGALNNTLNSGNPLRPSEFANKWHKENDLGEYVKQAGDEIGELKGMEGTKKIPDAYDISYLQNHPELADRFDKVHGVGSSQKYLTPTAQGYQ